MKFKKIQYLFCLGCMIFSCRSVLGTEDKAIESLKSPKNADANAVITAKNVKQDLSKTGTGNEFSTNESHHIAVEDLDDNKGNIPVKSDDSSRPIAHIVIPVGFAFLIITGWIGWIRRGGNRNPNKGQRQTNKQETKKIFRQGW